MRFERLRANGIRFIFAIAIFAFSVTFLVFRNSAEEVDMSRSFILQSKDFSHEGDIPKRHTCEGENISPELHWSGVPDGTKSLALIVDDPDAPDPAAPRMTWVHWVLYDIPTTTTSIAETNSRQEKLPDVGVQGKNDSGKLGYNGPCPPIGRHRYFFKLYALDTKLDRSSGATKSDLLDDMDGHILGETRLMGYYKK